MIPLSALFGLTAVVVVLLVITLLVLRSAVVVCMPDEVIVLSGRPRTLPDGSTVGFRVLRGGRAVRLPLLEAMDRMSLQAMLVDFEVSGAYSKGGIALSISGVCSLTISQDPALLNNAVERFLGRSNEEVARVAQESIEGCLRSLVATATPEELHEQRDKLAEDLRTEVKRDLDKLGLQLDVLYLDSIADDVDYLAAKGQKRLAEVMKEADAVRGGGGS